MDSESADQGDGPGRVDVSVVIVNWNTREFLRRCLESVYTETSGITFEVFVVDNDSHDDSAQMVRDSFPSVHLTANDTNRGFAAANNQAFWLASGTFVLMLNPDTMVTSGAVQKTVEYASHHPRCAVFGCQIREDEDRISKTCFTFPGPLNAFFVAVGLHRLFPRSRVFARHDMGWWDRKSERVVDVVCGAYMLVRREAMDAVGFLDEDYFVYGEETDWCYRFWKAGWECRFFPGAAIIHAEGGGKSTRQIRTKMFVQLQKSLLLFQRKNLGAAAYWTSRFIYLVSMFLRSGYWLMRRVIRPNPSAPDMFRCSLAAFRFHLSGREPAAASPEGATSCGEGPNAAES